MRAGGLRPLVELCVEPAGLCGRCTGVAVPLHVVPSPTGLPSKRGPGLLMYSLVVAIVRFLFYCLFLLFVDIGGLQKSEVGGCAPSQL